MRSWAAGLNYLALKGKREIPGCEEARVGLAGAWACNVCAILPPSALLRPGKFTRIYQNKGLSSAAERDGPRESPSPMHPRSFGHLSRCLAEKKSQTMTVLMTLLSLFSFISLIWLGLVLYPFSP